MQEEIGFELRCTIVSPADYQCSTYHVIILRGRLEFSMALGDTSRPSLTLFSLFFATQQQFLKTDTTVK
jgi:hypothetical protein